MEAPTWKDSSVGSIEAKLFFEEVHRLDQLVGLDSPSFDARDRHRLALPSPVSGVGSDPVNGRTELVMGTEVKCSELAASSDVRPSKEIAS
jgi:hypothetical protein